MGVWPNSRLLATDFLSKKSSVVWCHYNYFTAPDRVVARTISNRKYQTCLIFKTLDQAASDVIPIAANESEQASPTSHESGVFVENGVDRRLTSIYSGASMTSYIDDVPHTHPEQWAAIFVVPYCPGSDWGPCLRRPQSFPAGIEIEPTTFGLPV